jgi:hypothetical protein
MTTRGQPAASGNGYGNGNGNGNGNGGSLNYVTVHTARWQLMTSLAAVLIGVAGGFLTLMMNVNTLNNNVSALSARLASVETAANEERANEVTTRTSIAAIQRDLVEIETQFCAEDSMRNLMHANDLRFMGILWSKEFGIELPTANAYYPQVGRCAGQSNR